jgi:hypothetical protein
MKAKVIKKKIGKIVVEYKLVDDDPNEMEYKILKPVRGRLVIISSSWGGELLSVDWYPDKKEHENLKEVFGPKIEFESDLADALKLPWG